jgi:hypothetical protein
MFTWVIYIYKGIFFKGGCVVPERGEAIEGQKIT